MATPSATTLPPEPDAVSGPSPNPVEEPDLAASLAFGFGDGVNFEDPFMDLKKMMKQAQKMQRDAAAAQQEIAAMTFEASAGGGMVKATATGEMAITDITIDPAAVDPEDVEMLQDMVVAAVNEALRAASEAANARMNAVMGGMKIPGLM